MSESTVPTGLSVTPEARYETPSLTALGTLTDLTLGELTGANSDGVFSTDDNGPSIGTN